MNKVLLKPILAVAYITCTTCLILYLTNEIAFLKRENEKLRLESIPETVDRSSEHKLNNSVSHNNKVIGISLAKENEMLTEELTLLSEALAKAEEGKRALQEKLNELLKPLDEDILSSTLKATVKNNEVLVTGGYRTADGKFRYAMIEPVLEVLPDGRKAIRLLTRQYAIPEEAIGSFGLDSLSTNAGNTIQHGEIWTTKELRTVNESFSSLEGIDLFTSPALTVLPGMNAEIVIGEYRMSTISDFSEDGLGFDIELRIEQPRSAEKAFQSIGVGND